MNLSFVPELEKQPSILPRLWFWLIEAAKKFLYFGFLKKKKGYFVFREIFGIYYHSIWAQYFDSHEIHFILSYSNFSVLSIFQGFITCEGLVPTSGPRRVTMLYLFFFSVTFIGKKLSDLERVTSLKVYNWFANRRKEIKRRANIGNVSESPRPRVSSYTCCREMENT